MKKITMLHIPYTNQLEETRILFNYPTLDTQYLIDFAMRNFDIFLRTSSRDTLKLLERVLERTNDSYEYHPFKEALSYAFEDEFEMTSISK